MFATADWDWPYWTNKQHMAALLAQAGYHVLYVDSIGLRPLGANAIDVRRLVRRLWRGLRGIRQRRPGVWVFSPLTVPFAHEHPLVGRFNAWQLRRGLRAWLKRQGAASAMIWTYHPFMLDAIHALAPAAVVYHCVDDLGAVPGVDRGRYDRAERELLARADHVFATSRRLQQRCAEVAPGSTHYFANVADTDHFAAARRDGAIPDDLAAVPRPRLAYVGVISDFKIDLQLLESIARSRPDWQIVFIGDEREGQASPIVARLAAMANVHFLGWRPYARLPDYLRGIDVALLPQTMNEYTRSMFPMKFFEYLSAGRPVVATPLPALAEFAACHRIAPDAAGFVREIEAALANPAAHVLPADHPVLRQHSWRVRLDAMLAIVNSREILP
jgi:glycosyltransferase involved in cell wall biosynthesis